MSKDHSVSVSVIMPAYNAEKYLAQSVESALSQTVDNIEIIIVDDGSSDNTLHIANSFGAPVTVYSRENGGAAAARNFGVEKANGEWVAFLDADDLWEPNKLELQLESVHGFSWSHTDSIFIGDGHDGSVRASDLTPKYAGKVIPKLVVNNFVGTSTVLMKKDVYLKVGGFDESLRALQDWDFWLRLAAQYDLAYVPEVLAQYRVHAASTSRSARKTLPYHLEVIARTFSVDGVGAEVSHLKKETLAESYGICSLIAEDSNDPWFALSCALNAIRFQPTYAWRWKCALRIIIIKLFGGLIRGNHRP
jgi:glycosyltransferase involved in cell wall biosynthesis